ncbi:MAG TPA: hypothetical protein VFH16_01655 [Rubrobacter sp.]|jgi:hypothetical protein|nr:hypothetical protein [Rubrobacter sp.]
MRCLKRFDHPGGLELDVLAAKVLEHPGAAAEEHGYEVDRDLVYQPSPDVLLPDISPAHHGDVLVAGGCSRLLEGLLDPVGHEGVHASLGHLFGPGVGDDEQRNPGRTRRAIRSPPRNRKVVGASTRDDRPYGVHALREELAVVLVLAEGPLVKSLAAVAQRFLGTDVGRCHVPV